MVRGWHVNFIYLLCLVGWEKREGREEWWKEITNEKRNEKEIKEIINRRAKAKLKKFLEVKLNCNFLNIK